MKYPVYQDSVAHAMEQKGKQPFYILKNTLLNPSPLHHHDFVELSIVYAGSGTETINGTKHRMLPGTVSFLLPHHMHAIESDPDDPIRLYSCMFDIGLLFETQHDSELGRLLLQTGHKLPSYYDLDEARRARIIHLMEDIVAEFTGDAYGRTILIRHKLIEALLCLVRWHQEVRFPLPEKRTVTDPMGSILQYLHLHFTESISLKSLAVRFNWSSSYISRIFNEYTGTSFLDYLHTLRLNRGVALLLTTDLPITAISVEIGFEHFRTFSRVFKEAKGMSPSEFRLLNGRRESLRSQ